jgi:hypothetical protein
MKMWKNFRLVLVQEKPAKWSALLGILAAAFERALVFELWFVSDLQPVLLADVFIDLHHICIKRIEAVLLAPRNPVLRTALTLGCKSE